MCEHPRGSARERYSAHAPSRSGWGGMEFDFVAYVDFATSSRSLPL